MINDFFYEDDIDDDETNILIDNDDENELIEYTWADFNTWNLMNKTDRWDSRNYYPTDWELFIRERSE